MQIKPRSYPHPVLSHFGDDILDSAFQPTIQVKTTKTSYQFHALFKTSNKGLINLIASNKAEFAVHVECNSTRYRSLFRAAEEKFSFDIPANALDGRVELCSFVLASKDLSGYKVPGFHPDYADMSFIVRKADTLAVGPDRILYAEKKIDALKKIPSIFAIVPNDSEEAQPMDIDLSGDKVRVSLAKPNFETYRFLSKAQPMQSVLASMIVIPALIEVIERIKESAGNAAALSSFESRRWYRVLARRLKEIGINATDQDRFTDSSVTIAQRLIGNPLTHSLTQLKSYEESDE